jgi:endoglucanase
MRLTKSSFGHVAIAATLASVTLLACHEEAPPQTSAPAATAAAPAPAAPAAPNPGAGNSGVAESGPPPGPATVPDKDCAGADFVIDDAEDNNNQVARQGGRNGYWYTYADKQGTTISPPAHTKFLMSPGGARDSKYAAHMLGKVSANGDPLFAGMGFSFTDPKGPYDASKFTGISFWAKVGPGSTKTVRLKVPDVNTDPDGKVCKECYNDFGADLTLTDQWKKYTIPFAAMKQMKDWGDPTPAAINKSKLYGVQFQVNDSGASYDLWVDDLQLTGC